MKHVNFAQQASVLFSFLYFYTVLQNLRRLLWFMHNFTSVMTHCKPVLKG